MSPRKLPKLKTRDLDQACGTLSSGKAEHSTCSPHMCQGRVCLRCPACRMRNGHARPDDEVMVREALGLI